MNQRFLSVLVFAFVAATVSSLVLYRLFSGRASAAKPSAGNRVVVAAHNLEAGRLVREDDLALVDWTGTPPTAAATRKEDLVGRGVIATVYQNEAVLSSRLAAKGAGGGLAPMIPLGMRAVAVRVNEVVGVAGFAVPGMRVDVLVSGTAPGPAGAVGMITRTLLQNMEVLSAGQDFKKDAEGKPISVQVVNLLATPEHAEMLSLAANQMTIQLVLRNPLDTTITTPPGTAVSKLLRFGSGTPGWEEAQPPAPRPPSQPVRASLPPPTAALPPPAPPAPPPPVLVEILQGGKRVETKFEKRPED
jgi:pilus assembly protein CpaB